MASGARSQRSIERLRTHWEIERELAQRLRSASREERTSLYGSVYDELFRRVPDHPQLMRKTDVAEQQAAIRDQVALVKHFLARGENLVEVGAGDCALSLALASYAGRVYAIEVSREISRIDGAPSNFQLAITDGREIPAPDGSIDLVYSNQLMEHLHPDDAIEQLQNIFTVLRPGGRYVCLTPNRLLGPSDISKYFEDEIASGFHLREYSLGELRDLFRSVGFGSVRTLVTLRGSAWAAPIAPVLLGEALLQALPRAFRRRAKHWKLVRRLLHPGGGVVATKSPIQPRRVADSVHRIRMRRNLDRSEGF
jgi:SAM-dependent methyltransferase